MKRDFYPLNPWELFSEKLIQKIGHPHAAGSFPLEQLSGMRLVKGVEGDYSEGAYVALYLLIDESDGIISDVKFHCFGPSYLIGIAEMVSEILLRKNYEQAMRISADMIEKRLRDYPDRPALPREAHSSLNLVISAINVACEQCHDIEIELHSPVEEAPFESSGDYPDWSVLTKEEKIALIEEVVAKEVRPYIELDAGGVEILDLKDDREVLITYEGACTTCYSATGSTLTAIQGILRAKVHPALIVTPDLSLLN